MGGLLSSTQSTLIRPQTLRRVFFSFHYERDVFRANVVKNHWVTKGTITAAGFFNGSLEEEAKTKGDQAVKRLINSGMEGSSVLCVLIGAKTYDRRWVDYEIFRAVSRGMGIFGVLVHQIKDPRMKLPDASAPNPFSYLGVFEKSGSDKLWPGAKYGQEWKFHTLADDGISRSAAPYLPQKGYVHLNTLFPVYDWVANDGFNAFSSWVGAAAKRAGL